MKLFEVIYKGTDSLLAKDKFIAKDMVNLFECLLKKSWINTIKEIKELDVEIYESERCILCPPAFKKEG